VSSLGSESAEGPISLPDVPLFAGIASGPLESLERFMMRFDLAPGERLFRQGDQGGGMYVIGRGRLEIQVELTAGHTQALAQLGPGEVLGEISLLGNERRTATAVACEATSGWMLARAGFEMLRLDVSPGAVELMARIVELAVERLRGRYETIATELGAHDGAAAESPSREAGVPAATELASPEYLRGLLCFREFYDDKQIAGAIGEATPVDVQSGAVVVAADAVTTDLLLIVRGAVNVSVRHGGTAQRVRLAGPGRFVGHVGVLDGEPSPVVAHARERVVLLHLPGERVREMLREPSALARRFSAALAKDVARALWQAERPMARTSA
jgi:CRP/FNR family transcriptional regulator, cyclic AMP receptor protein